MVNKQNKKRRVVVVVVPPVEELDLVGPMQVFSAANRLAGKDVYALEIATSKDDLKVEGEGGMLSFLAQHRLSEVNGTIDSVLLVCGVATRSIKRPGPLAMARKRGPGSSSTGRCLRCLIPACRSRFTKRQASHDSLEVRKRAHEAVSENARRNRANLGQGWKPLYVGRDLRRHRSRTGVG